MFVKELVVEQCDVGLNRFSNGTSCTDYWEAITVRSIFGEACDQAGCVALCMPLHKVCWRCSNHCKE